MADVHRDGWSLHYEVVGPADGPALVLVAGLGEQIGSVEFPDGHCELLAADGYRVVRVDNRDNGISVPDVDPGDPDWAAIMSAAAAGAAPPVAYTLADLGDDIAAIIDDADLGRATIVGASMGTAIARWTAIRHPDRVGALMLVMGMSGAGPGDDGPTIADEVLGRLMGLAVRQDRDTAVQYLVDCWRWLWGSNYAFDEQWVRARVEASYRRAYRPQGVARNMAAFTASGLWDAQEAIACPTLVMHGEQDPCCPPEHGRAIASKIPNAELWEVAGMGHTMHHELWPDMTKRLADLVTT